MIAHRQARRLYRIKCPDGTIAIRPMTPAQAAQYSERYDTTATPVGFAPLAPEGTLERGATLAQERPRR
jgi:hypothetical protein